MRGHRAGLEGDRRWAFIDGMEPRVGKFFNIKQDSGLMRYRARLVDGKLEVTAPDGISSGLVGALTTLLGESKRVVNVRDQAGANFDDAPVLIVNLASVAAVSLEARMPVEIGRASWRERGWLWECVGS